jgi:hypothetical protein
MLLTVEEIKKEVFSQLDGLDPGKVVLFEIDRDDKLVENYTLVYFPEGDVINNLESEVGQIKSIQNDLFFLEREKWHITMIGEIGLEIDEKKLIDVIKNELLDMKITFNVTGYASNKSTASFLTYPDFDLHSFRENIRQKLGIAGTDYTIHLSVYEFMGWINFVRYISVPNIKFFEYIKERRDVDFGNINSGKLKLLRNRSRTLRDGEFEVVHEF